VGLSDHTLGTTASVASVALRACVIEKHFTLSRADKGPDSEFSMEPNEFKILCHEVKNAWSPLGQYEFGREKTEEGSKIFRRSLYITQEMKKGEKNSKEKVRSIRPGFGLAPKHLKDLLGKQIKKDVAPGTPFLRNLVE